MSGFVQQSFAFGAIPKRGRQNAVIEAGAGTGKTTRIVKEVVLRLLDEPELSPDRIVLVTFTEKAAAEIADRVRWALTDLYLNRDAAQLSWPAGSAQPVILVPEEKREAYAAACGKQLQSADRLKSQTIHSFCQSILKAFPIEAGLDPRFGIVQGFERSRLFQEVFDRFIHDEMLSGDDRLVGQWRVALDRLGWIERVRQTVLALSDRRELMENGAYDLGGIDDVHDRLVAAVESLRRVDAALCGPSARRIIEHLQGAGAPPVADLNAWIEFFTPVGDALRSADLREFKGADPIDVKLIRGEDKKKSMIDLLQQHEAAMALRDITVRFVAAADEEKMRRGVLDFDDLLVRTDRLLEDARVLNAVRARFDYIFVDEFQDTDRVQARLIDRLARSSDDNLLVQGRTVLVGDPKQSIYSFRRADPEMFAQTIESFILEGADREYLEQQYRSDPPLVEAINAMFGELFPESAASSELVARPAYRALTSARKEPHRSERSRLHFLAAPTIDELEDTNWIEAQLAADYILRDSGGHHLYRYAILLRKMTSSSVYADVFERRGIPLLLPPGRALLEQRPCVDLIAVLRAIAFPFDRGTMISAARTPYFALSDDEIVAFYLYEGESELKTAYATFVEEIEKLGRASREMTVSELVESVVELRQIETFYRTLKGGERALAHLDRFRDLASDYTLDTGGALRNFVDELTHRRLQGDDAEPVWADDSIDAVRLMTVHGSKGLEFETVLLADLGSSTRIDDLNAFVIDNPPTLAMTGSLQSLSADFRSSGGRSMRQIEKERDAAELDRLFYVAVTRAKSHVAFVTTIGKKNNQSFWKPLTTIFDFDMKSFDSLFGGEVGLVERFLNVGSAALPVTFERAAPPLRHDSDLSRFNDPHLDALAREMIVSDLVPSPLSVGQSLDSAEIARRRSGERKRESGIVLHRALELWNGEAQSLPNVMKRVGEEFALLPELRTSVEGKLRRLGRSATLQRIRSASVVGRELPIFFDSNDGPREGRIDLLLRENDRYLVVDYKSGVPYSERIEKDSTQIRDYCRALNRATGELASGLLWYIDDEDDSVMIVEVDHEVA